jgi:hypothetical protein
MQSVNRGFLQTRCNAAKTLTELMAEVATHEATMSPGMNASFASKGRLCVCVVQGSILDVPNLE